MPGMMVSICTQDIESHVSHAMALRKEYDVLVDDDLVLAAVDDFCRLTVRHRVRKAGALSSPFDAGDARAESMDSLESKQAVPRPRRHSPGVRHRMLSCSDMLHLLCWHLGRRDRSLGSATAPCRRYFGPLLGLQGPRWLPHKDAVHMVRRPWEHHGSSRATGA